MIDFLKRIVLVLATGYLLAYFSEFSFWAHYNAEMALPVPIFTWLLYSIFSYFFMITVVKFKARSIWALVITGSVYGWITEGIITDTLYGSHPEAPFPYSISWTGIAWHSLISVVVGWYIVRKALMENNYNKARKMSIIIGLVYGYWATGWILEGAGTSIPLFAAFVFVTTLLLIVSYWFYDILQPLEFKPTKTEIGVLVFAAVWIFILWTVFPEGKPHNIPALYVLPSLILIALIALWKNKKTESDTDALNFLLKGKVERKTYKALLYIPFVAVIFYSIFYLLPAFAIVTWKPLVYYVLMPFGFVAFAFSFFRIMQKKPSSLH